MMKLFITNLILFFICNLSFATDKNCILEEGINVETGKRRLFICSQGKVIKEFKIALGTQGTGKKVEGDRKTPLGLYPLERPRASSRFGIFIPIQYPTPLQISAGYTGTHIGLHGPIQSLNWLSRLFLAYDWTAGCIALGKNEQIDFVADWISAHPQAQIYIG